MRGTNLGMGCDELSVSEAEKKPRPEKTVPLFHENLVQKKRDLRVSLLGGVVGHLGEERAQIAKGNE